MAGAGYNAPLLDTTFAGAREDLGVPKTGATVRDFFRTQEGKDFWSKEGGGMSMKFDLTDGSDDRQWLDDYMEAKAKGKK